MVMTMSSSAIRSSIENSPWSRMISVRRSSPKVAAMSSHLCHQDAGALLARGEDALAARRSSPHLGELGLELVSISSAVSRASRMSRMASALGLGEPEPLAQLRRSASVCLRPADDRDHLVDVVDGDLEALEDVLALLRLGEVELGPPDDDLVPVLDEVLEHLLQRHHLRLRR
jgi:hypothetical protein